MLTMTAWKVPSTRWLRLAMLAFSLPAAGLSLAADRVTYTLGVVPQFDTITIHNSWSPFLEELSRRVGADIELKHYVSIPRFEEELVTGGPDLAYMNPYHAVMVHKTPGYVPLVRDDSSQLKGVLVTRVDGPIKELADLNGSELVFPSPNAFGASLYMRALLTEEIGLKFTPSYVLTHGNVYRNVILGRTNAGGGVMRTLLQEPEAIRKQLRVLYTTPGVPSHPLSAHPRLPAEFRERLTNAILDMGKEEELATLLEAVQLTKPIVADYVRDYTQLERLNLDKYVVTE